MIYIKTKMYNYIYIYIYTYIFIFSTSRYLDGKEKPKQTKDKGDNKIEKEKSRESE